MWNQRPTKDKKDANGGANEGANERVTIERAYADVQRKHLCPLILGSRIVSESYESHEWVSCDCFCLLRRLGPAVRWIFNRMGLPVGSRSCLVDGYRGLFCPFGE